MFNCNNDCKCDSYSCGESSSDSVPLLWMVYGEGQSMPRVTHDTKESAITEAGRLAEKHPGIVFYVLAATAAYLASPPKAKRVCYTSRYWS